MTSLRLEFPPSTADFPPLACQYIPWTKLSLRTLLVLPFHAQIHGFLHQIFKPSLPTCLVSFIPNHVLPEPFSLRDSPHR